MGFQSTGAEALLALSPLDGRYHNKVAGLQQYFSEAALIRYRILVEVEYLIYLAGMEEVQELPAFSANDLLRLREIYTGFSVTAAEEVKAIEKQINHDVKAVEYYLKDYLAEHFGLSAGQREFVHFGLTSQDINNTAFPLMLRDSLQEVFFHRLERLIQAVEARAEYWQNLSMLARTHGQPASPTTLGKEMAVFATRLTKAYRSLRGLRFPAKFGGATGGLNAHYVAYPEVDWHTHFSSFIEHNFQGLERSLPTTQIEHYDGLAALFDNLRRINVILIDFSRDIWQYIALDYLKQQVNPNEVGSSAMPHKVNPIDFENAEGNLGLANALFDHLSNKLPVSRLQRDLSDSTVLRNIGVPLGYSLVALASLEKGLSKIAPNEPKLAADLNDNWAVLAEAIQTVLRKAGRPNAYEGLKELTRTGERLTPEGLRSFIQQLGLPKEIESRLLALRPADYTGKPGQK